MSRATEGFAALASQGVGGLHRNLATLHHPLLIEQLAGRHRTATLRTLIGEPVSAQPAA